MNNLVERLKEIVENCLAISTAKWNDCDYADNKRKRIADTQGEGVTTKKVLEGVIG